MGATPRPWCAGSTPLISEEPAMFEVPDGRRCLCLQTRARLESALAQVAQGDTAEIRRGIRLSYASAINSCVRYAELAVLALTRATFNRPNCGRAYKEYAACASDTGST